jgi:hypothetical protein
VLLFVTGTDCRFPQKFRYSNAFYRQSVVSFSIVGNVMDVVRGASSLRLFVFFFVFFGIAAVGPFSSSSFSLSVYMKLKRF